MRRLLRERLDGFFSFFTLLDPCGNACVALATLCIARGGHVVYVDTDASKGFEGIDSQQTAFSTRHGSRGTYAIATPSARRRAATATAAFTNPHSQGSPSPIIHTGSYERPGHATETIYRCAGFFG